jgi:DNA-binding NarL/FixJ family response regulator
MITVLLADDHDLMRQGVRTLLETHPNVEICGEARNGVEAVDKAIDLCPDVVVLDVSMPEMDGLEAARRIRKHVPNTKILVFTVYDANEMVRDMIDAGAHGYILKSDAYSHLAAAVEAVAQHDLYFSAGVSNVIIDSMLNSRAADMPEETQHLPLTAREIDIVKLLSQGKSNKQIATELYISVRTVESHRRSVHRKLGFNSLAELVRYAIRHHMLRP